MFKILKNLKKTWMSVVVIVILLCVQAWADLELPSYTSKIVNIGIQARSNELHIRSRYSNARNGSDQYGICH